MAKAKFTIVILTKNSLGVIETLVDALLAQDFDHGCEVIFMDNSSTDDTVAYLQKTPFRDKKIVNVPEGEFSHSRTRMKAAAMAKGDWILFFTDDIVPMGKDFLAQLTRPLLEGQALAAYGVWQIDEKKWDPIDAYLHNDWYRAIDDIVEPIPQYCWGKFPPELKRRLCNFDNCASCIERKLLLDMKFPDVPYGEDMLFARQLILNGHRVAIAKAAKFFHWHKVSFTYLMRRMCIDQHLSIPEFGIYYVRRKLGVIKAILIRVLHRTLIGLFKLKKVPLHRRIYWICYNIKTLTADFIGKYMGVLDEDSIKGFSPINKRLLKKKNQYIDDIHKKSIRRY